MLWVVEGLAKNVCLGAVGPRRAEIEHPFGSPLPHRVADEIEQLFACHFTKSNACLLPCRPAPVFQGFLTRTCVSLRETIVCRIDRAAFLCILTAFLPLFGLFVPLAVRAVRHIAQRRTLVCCFQRSGRSGSDAPL